MSLDMINESNLPSHNNKDKDDLKKYRNKESVFFDSVINVRNMHSYIKSFLLEKYSNVKLSISYYHIGLSKLVHIVIDYLIKKNILLINKDENNANMYDLSTNNLKMAIMTDNNLRCIFGKFIDGYDNNIHSYVKLVKMDAKDIKNLVNNTIFSSNNGTSILLSNDTVNFIGYLINIFVNELINASYIMCECFNKKTLNLRVLEYALRLKCDVNGELYHHMIMNIEFVKDRITIRNHKEENYNDNETNDDDDDTETKDDDDNETKDDDV